MTVETSAMIAVLRREPEATAFNIALLRWRRGRLSMGSLIETRIIAERYGLGPDLEALLGAAGVETVPVDGTLPR